MEELAPQIAAHFGWIDVYRARMAPMLRIVCKGTTDDATLNELLLLTDEYRALWEAHFRGRCRVVLHVGGGAAEDAQEALSRLPSADEDAPKLHDLEFAGQTGFEIAIKIRSPRDGAESLVRTTLEGRYEWEGAVLGSNVAEYLIATYNAAVLRAMLLVADESDVSDAGPRRRATPEKMKIENALDALRWFDPLLVDPQARGLWTPISADCIVDSLRSSSAEETAKNLTKRLELTKAGREGALRAKELATRCFCLFSWAKDVSEIAIGNRWSAILAPPTSCREALERRAGGLQEAVDECLLGLARRHGLMVKLSPEGLGSGARFAALALSVADLELVRHNSLAKAISGRLEGATDAALLSSALRYWAYHKCVLREASEVGTAAAEAFDSALGRSVRERARFWESCRASFGDAGGRAIRERTSEAFPCAQANVRRSSPSFEAKVKSAARWVDSVGRDVSEIFGGGDPRPTGTASDDGPVPFPSKPATRQIACWTAGPSSYEGALFGEGLGLGAAKVACASALLFAYLSCQRLHAEVLQRMFVRGGADAVSTISEAAGALYYFDRSLFPCAASLEHAYRVAKAKRADKSGIPPSTLEAVSAWTCRALFSEIESAMTASRASLEDQRRAGVLPLAKRAPVEPPAFCKDTGYVPFPKTADREALRKGALRGGSGALERAAVLLGSAEVREKLSGWAGTLDVKVPLALSRLVPLGDGVAGLEGADPASASPLSGDWRSPPRPLLALVEPSVWERLYRVLMLLRGEAVIFDRNGSRVNPLEEVSHDAVAEDTDNVLWYCAFLVGGVQNATRAAARYGRAALSPDEICGEYYALVVDEVRRSERAANAYRQPWEVGALRRTGR
jgi:hypothetical protein